MFKLSFFAAVTAGVLSAAHAQAQCQGRWVYAPEQQASAKQGVNGQVNACITWDPDGPADIGAQPRIMIIGGAFTATADGDPIAHIAYWNGRQWTRLGTGLNGDVTALTLWDPDGPGPMARQLVAGGAFTMADGQPAAHLARFDGFQWYPVGGGTVGIVYGLTTWDPDGDGPLPEQLIASGDFVSAGGTPATRIARFDGSQWSALGAGFDKAVFCVASWDPDGPGPQTPRLFAGGSFQNSGSTPVSRIGMWDGAQWQPVGGGLSSDVTALLSWDRDGSGPGLPRLVATGGFSVGSRIAQWDGAAWSGLGTGLGGGGSVIPYGLALVAFDPDGDGPLPSDLVVAGGFVTAGGVAAGGVAAWNGSAWRSVGATLIHSLSPATYTFPRAVTALPSGSGGDTLLVGGNIDTFVVQGDGTQWVRFPTGLSNIARAATTWYPQGPGGGRLVLGGSFTFVKDISSRAVVAWDGVDFTAMSTGTGGAVKGFTHWDPDGPGPMPEEILAAGSFTGSAGNYASRWNGTTWQSFATNPASSALALTLWDPDGAGPLVPTPTISGAGVVRYWTGSVWQQMGLTYPGSPAPDVLGLATLDPDGPGPLPYKLYNIHDTPAFVDSWEPGEYWNGVLGGPDNRALAMTRWDPDGDGPIQPVLVVGGVFTSIGASTPAPFIATWDGVAWHAFPSPGGQVWALGTFDPDGPGPSPTLLIASGYFTVGGSQSIAAYDGVSWQPLGLGLNNPAISFTTFEPNGPGTTPVELIAVGDFNSAGGEQSRYWARWSPTGIPWIAHQPQDKQIAAGETAPFTVAPAQGYDFDGPLSYQWRRNGTPIANGPGGASAGGGTVEGAHDAVLVISAAQLSDAGGFDCTVSNGCGSATSLAATLAVAPATCPADLNGDGLVDFSDYLEFLNLYDAQDPAADFNGDGLVDFSDYLEFLNHYDAGC